MKNSDEAGELIDRVLAGLRDVEAADGMERRIMEAVQKRTAVRQIFPLGWFALAGFALAAAVAVALLVGPPHASVSVPAQAAVRSQAQSLPPAAASAPLRPLRHKPAIRANAEAPALRASFPAPPMPLTEQERLLIRVARRGQPAELPVLDPEALAQQEARSEQVFQAVLASAQEPSILKQKEDIR